MKMKITTVHQYQMHLSHPPLTVSLLSQHARTSPTYAHTLANVRKHSTYSLSLLSSLFGSLQMSYIHRKHNTFPQNDSNMIHLKTRTAACPPTRTCLEFSYQCSVLCSHTWYHYEYDPDCYKNNSTLE